MLEDDITSPKDESLFHQGPSLRASMIMPDTDPDWNELIRGSFPQDFGTIRATDTVRHNQQVL